MRTGRVVTPEAHAALAAAVVDEWVRAGVTEAVLVPGEAQAPLALALMVEGRIRLHVFGDGRAGAFFAVGLARATARPAVVVSGAGAGTADLGPAIAEAERGRVPLVVCIVGAELAAVGAQPSAEGWRERVRRSAEQAADGSHGPGPAHLELCFPGSPELAPIQPSAPADLVQALTAQPRRGLVIAGAGAGDPIAIHGAAAALGWPVLADAASGCRIPADTTVAAADGLLASAAPRRHLAPEIVLRAGAPWSSPTIDSAVSGWGATIVGASAGGHVDATELCRTLAAAATGVEPGGWLSAWRQAERAAQAAIDATLADIVPITEPWLARVLTAQLPDGSALVTSGSMAGLDIERYSRPRTGLRVVPTEEGAAGGAVSTALGVAAAHAGPTVALVGDLGFLHDTNGLMAIRGTAAGLDCTVVVVDNNGSGRHSFLPDLVDVPEAQFERLFGAPHGLDLPSVAAAHGAPAYRVNHLPEFLPTVEAAMAAGGVRVVHVRTDRQLNVSVHRRIDEAVAAAVAAVRADAG